MASFLLLPTVVRVKILSHLTLKEQLCLRETCVTTKDWIDTSSLAFHAPVTRINDNGAKTFTTFLERRPPHIITAMYIENDTKEFLHDPALPYFMQTYATHITSLRMSRFFPCTSSQETEFFEGFVNLEELQLDKISIPSDRDLVCSFPSVFKNLKSLKIGDVKAYPEPPEDTFGSTLIPLNRQRPMGRYVWNLIKYCENLEFLGYPKTSKYFFQAFVDGRGRGEFGVFCDYVRERNLNPNGSQLKYCDLQNDNGIPDSKNALPLLKLGTEFKVKFLNVDANLFQFIRIDSLIKMYDLHSTAGDCIVSFKNFNCLITKCLPSVDKISMSASEVNTILDYSCMFNGPNSFPYLREIEIIIDVGFSLPETDIYHRAREFQGVQTLLAHFFYDTEMILQEDQEELLKHVRVYKSVQNLTVKFVNLPSKTMKKANPEDLPLEWIIRSLPNLRKLKLIGWNPQRPETYSTIAIGFPKLEELHLVDCEKLEESSLYGTGRYIVAITRKVDSDQIKSLDTILCDFLEENDFSVSEFLHKSSQHREVTWCQCTGES